MKKTKNMQQQNKASTSIRELFILRQARELKVCNYADNYYGDQQCFVVRQSKVS
jgi:hypothetical protein